MKKHVIKTENQYFIESLLGNKNFEIRKNDRDYKTGDEVVLLEYMECTKTYSGREMKGKITYVTDYAQKPGFVVFGVEFL